MNTKMRGDAPSATQEFPPSQGYGQRLSHAAHSILRFGRSLEGGSAVVAVVCEPQSAIKTALAWPPSTLTVLAVQLHHKLIALARVIQKYLQKDLLCRGSKESNLDFPFRVWLFELVKGWPSPVRAFEISQGRAA
jgi:hypothetical protein